MLSGARTFNREAAHGMMAMITSADNSPWPLDTPISDSRSAGLSSPSVTRMKLFTLDHRFVLRKAGRLSSADAKKTTQAVRKALFV